MATAPSPEDSARFILHIFVHEKQCKPGHILQQQQFIPFFVPPRRASDYNEGVRHAFEMGWIEHGAPAASLKLTQAGFDEAQTYPLSSI
ncbi:MAG: hypothetical protein WDO24_13515 [Pseudomonadota bacterium]